MSRFLSWRGEGDGRERPEKGSKERGEDVKVRGEEEEKVEIKSIKYIFAYISFLSLNKDESAPRIEKESGQIVM